MSGPFQDMMTTESTADENRVPQADRTVPVPIDNFFLFLGGKHQSTVAVSFKNFFLWEKHHIVPVPLEKVLVITLTPGGLVMCKHD